MYISMDFPTCVRASKARLCEVGVLGARRPLLVALYGQFSKCHVCFCGLDPGNLKFETVRTNKQHICF